MVTVLVASRTVPPLAMSAYDLTLALPCAASTARIAAVRVVLPWSMCPIVPTLTCGLVRWKTSFAILISALQNNGPRRIWAGRCDHSVHATTELLLGVEPRTSSLPRTRSTTELKQHHPSPGA